ncbi:MAG: dihydrofolate reductase family protein [Anaerolineales bacterium]|jgi:dihydrofolate reductase
MRQLIALEYLTLDGVMEAPEKWQFPYLSEDVTRIIQTQIQEADAILLGRVTYDIFAASWPNRTNNEFGVADKLNSAPKFVVSSTLDKVEWNNSTLIKGKVEEEIAMLKQQPGGNIAVIGSATLVQSLMEYDLIDEYRLMIHPIVLGSGKHLFEDGSALKSLKLVNSEVTTTGVVNLTYRPRRNGDS